jgi:hypothetical protein
VDHHQTPWVTLLIQSAHTSGAYGQDLTLLLPLSRHTWQDGTSTMHVWLTPVILATWEAEIRRITV